MALESKFQAALVRELKLLFPGAILLKNDPNYIQGFPDWTILYGPQWACLETKRQSNSHQQPNQDYYVRLLNRMSYSSFISPENKEDVINDLQHTFNIGRRARFFVSK